MKVIVAGYPKTGTKSMTAALKILGYTVYDYEHNFFYLGKHWIKIISTGGTKEDFYRMYKDVDAVVDMPASMFWEEILEAFPDAKIVFTTRKSEDEWLESWEKQIKAAADNRLMTALGFLSPTARAIFRYGDYVGRAMFCAPPQRFYRNFLGISPTLARRRYRNHNAAVMQRAPKERTLCFRPTDGWEPLCKFLGTPVPEENFPHKNKSATLVDDLLRESPVFHKMQQEMKIVLAATVLVFASLLYWLFL